MNEQPKVSVIIPVYNTEQFLRECLDSVVNQTLRDIEIICVDDGSTDGSPVVLEEYAEKDHRVAVIKKENGGQSSARNRGMLRAAGEYIYFLDSDDYIRIDALEQMYRISKNNQLDILLFSGESFYESSELENVFPSFKEAYQRKETSHFPITGSEMMLRMLEKRQFLSNVPFMLINRGYLEKSGVAFFEGIIHEDELFTPLALVKANRVLAIEDAFYFRRVHHGPTMTTKKSAKNFDGYFLSFSMLLAEAMKLDSEKKAEREALLHRAKDIYRVALRTYRNLNDDEKDKSLNSALPEFQYIFQIFMESDSALQIKVKQALDDLKQAQGKLEQKQDELKQAQGELKQAQGKLEQTQSELKHSKEKEISLRQDLDAVHRSASYRIGRVITWLPRKTRGGIRCFKENGLRYTIRRMGEKVRGN